MRCEEARHVHWCTDERPCIIASPNGSRHSVDEILATFCNRIDVTIHCRRVDFHSRNGRGIPVECTGVPTSGVELVLTTLHSGAMARAVTLIPAAHTESGQV